ncbi:MAG: DUF4956 domain-containing protein [Planctomycetota bacterium]|nr:MAG: DUF4956 domain-containing protein [Planctomycetota bacterium]
MLPPSLFPPPSQPSASVLVLPEMAVVFERALLSILLGFLVALVYRFTLARRDGWNNLSTTLVLLCVLIGLVTLVIGDNLARAFGLVGALSIVRFRTVVEDTRDTAFVIFAVIMGMAAGAGYGMVAVVALPVVSTAAVLMLVLQNRSWPGGGYSARLEVRVAVGLDADRVLMPILRKHALRIHLLGVGSAKQGSCLELNYRVTLVERAVLYPLASELQAMEGVVGVNLQGADGDKR